MTYINNSEIKSLGEVVNTFRARIAFRPGELKITSDSIQFETVFKNFGARTAYDVSGRIYFVTNEMGCFTIDANSIPFIEPSEVIKGQAYYLRNILNQIPHDYITDDELHGFGIAMKTIYTDVVTDIKDSAYHFSINITKNLDTIILKIASEDEEKWIRKNIDEYHKNIASTDIF